MKLQRQIDRLIAQRASEWHQVLESADEAQRAAFVAWLKESPLHLREYLEIVYADRVLDHIDAQRLVDVDALIAQASPNVVAFGDRATSPVAQQPRSRRWMLGAAAAAIVALCVISVSFVRERALAGTEYSTTIGEQRTVQLADASIVTINADSRLRVRLDERHRDIQLLRGEALFEVAPDARRPFRVRTETAIVQAVGTQFNVYERPDGAQVSVLEGRVNLIPQHPAAAGATSGPAAVASLGAGQEAQVRPDGTIQRNAKADVMKTVAWRERRLIFEEAPLEEMVREFNRYSRATRLTLQGVPRGSRHYNGIFDAADPQSLADLLSKEPDLTIERRDGEIVICQK